jgi:hypothetical protein
MPPAELSPPAADTRRGRRALIVRVAASASSLRDVSGRLGVTNLRSWRPVRRPSGPAHRPGRPHKPLPSGDGPILQVSGMLRGLKETAGKTFRDISGETGYSLAVLTTACRGERLPSWAVTRAFVRVCHGDEQIAREVYTLACRAEGREAPDHAPVAADPPDPADAVTPAEFVASMRQLRRWAGNPPLVALNARSGGHLPPSTVSGVLRRDALPRLDLLSHFVRACQLPDHMVAGWEDAWTAIKELGEAPAEEPDGQEEAQREERDPATRPPFPRKLARSLPVIASIVNIFVLAIISVLILGPRVNSFLHPANAARPSTPPAFSLIDFAGHTSPITSVTLSPDGKTITITLANNVRLRQVIPSAQPPRSSR